jgi:membrane fusion protein (multidrug efflux system)
MNLPEGKKVAAGTLLLKIFDEDLQTQLRKLDAQLAIARTTAQRLKGLLDVKGTSQQEYDLAELQIKNTEAEMELLRVKIRQTEIRAPYSGVIGLRQISPGAYITPATAIATIRDDSKLRLDFSVPEKYGVLIRTGQTIHFKVDGSDRSYAAVVNASEQNIDVNTRDLRLRAIVNEQSPELAPGRFAEVDLTLSTRPKAIMIPTEAVIPQAKDKKVVVSKDGKAKFVTVTTGIRQAGMVEITSGLLPGDTIVTAGMLFLRPDVAISFSKVQ